LFESVENRRAAASLIFARVVYAINWLNVGAIFVLMSPDLGVGKVALGTLTSTFYLGIGAMQVPGGLLAAKWGPKKVVVLGVFLSSFAVLGTAASSNIAEIAALRFAVGMGMAFVFAPGVVIVAGLFRGRKTGMGVGLFNSAYDFGGVLGLFGWVVLATVAGWRPSLALSGGLGVLTGMLVAFFVPGEEDRTGFEVRGSALWRLLGDRDLVLLGLGTLGFSVGNIVISTFMVEYLFSSLSVSPSLAGLVDSAVVVFPIFTAIWAGRMYDKTPRPRLVMMVALVGSSVALAFGAYPSVYTAFACAALGGVVSGVGYTFAFAAARDLNRVEGYDTLAIAWVNSISLTGSFLPPLLYSYVAVTAGYAGAWLASAALGLVFLVPLAMMEEGLRARAA
jgi:MFS family permease